MPAKPTSEDYRFLIEREWADLHHSRVQEWTALGVVTGAHVGLVQLLRLAKDIPVPVTLPAWMALASLTGSLFATLGALITCRHRRLMQIKLGWIYEAEERLGLIQKGDNPEGVVPESARMPVPLAWRGLALPRLLSTSGLILCFYALLFLIDAAVLLAVLLRR